MTIQANERILSDDYPVYWDYLYVCDETVCRSPINGTVKDLKRVTGAREVKNCDMLGRELFTK